MQLDALQLDNDIIRIVHNQVVNAAHNISVLKIVYFKQFQKINNSNTVS